MHRLLSDICLVQNYCWISCLTAAVVLLPLAWQPIVQLMDVPVIRMIIRIICITWILRYIENACEKKHCLTDYYYNVSYIQTFKVFLVLLLQV